MIFLRKIGVFQVLFRLYSNSTFGGNEGCQVDLTLIDFQAEVASEKKPWAVISTDGSAPF
jgi:hypothetical protein